MSIEKLVSLVHPPVRPLERGDAKAWATIQRQVGVTLSKDLYEFAMRYGTGQFAGDLQVFNPFSKSYLLILKVMREQLELTRSLGLGGYLDRFLENLGFESGTGQPGLFPWGRDSNGNRYYWLTDGEPENWPIITATEESEFAEWQMPMTQFLANLFSNDIVGFLAPEPLAAKELVFQSKLY